MLLYGKRPVLERLKAAPHTIRALYIERDTDATEIVRAAKAAKISFTPLSKSEFRKRAGEMHASGGTSGAATEGSPRGASDSRIHAQGILAEVGDFQYTSIEDLLKAKPPPTLLFLDRVADPQNLGNILRSVACFGGIALVLPKHDAAEVNETVLRIACGGENFVPIARVTNLTQAVEFAKDAGYWIAGAVTEGGTPLPESSWTAPIGVVLGSEGTGIRPGLAKHLDLKVTLPMPGAALSFNVATAAALIAYELTKSKSR